MEKIYIATTKNHKRVYFRTSSHAATHLQDTPELLACVKEVLANLEPESEKIYTDHDMGREVGTTDLVETTDKDEILYVKRLNRDNYTRFVKNRTAQPTNYITIILNRDSAGEYELFSAWTGRAAPQFPGDELETAESRPFWQTHALVWGNQAVQENSEVYEWPW
jgi:hypothetical protein